MDMRLIVVVRRLFPAHVCRNRRDKRAPAPKRGLQNEQRPTVTEPKESSFTALQRTLPT